MEQPSSRSHSQADYSAHHTHIHHSHSHHSHSHHSLSHHHATQNITLAFFLNLLFAFIELVGGLYTNSIAILSDALHDFGDSLSLGVAWYLQKISRKGRDKEYTYGYKRFSLLGALFISTVLLVGSFFVIKECVERLMHPQVANAQGMLLLALLGIVINGFAALRLMRGGSISERAVSLHMLEDLFGWVAVLVVSIVMLFVDLPILDPILSIAISLWVLYNVYKNLKETFRVFLQQAPQDVDIEQLQESLQALEGISSIHDIHLWSLDGESNVMTLHVVIAQDLSVAESHALKCRIRTLLNEKKITHATIEIEVMGEECELLHC